MTWMITRTGAHFDLQHIAPLSISTLDIAHALANINRFTGHAMRPYSVAEHSLLVVEIMERDLGVRQPGPLLAGLLHDAHEAYTGDLSTPMKDMIDAASAGAWRREEQRIADAVLQRFNILYTSQAHHELVKRADLMALATERRDLLPATPDPWPCLHGVQPAGWVDLNTRDHFDWVDWKQGFLDKFAELNYALDLHARKD
jgi:5'-deoxynucleotidase YfbR-like HD superfamily hydrolase